MLEKYKSQITKFLLDRYHNKSRRYSMTEESLIATRELSKGAFELLFEIIKRSGRGFDVEDLLVVGKYDDFHFKHSQHFYRYRKELVKAGFLYFDKDIHYVNPDMIEYHSRRQMDHFNTFLGIKPKPKVSWGNLKKDIPPPPKT